jgi:Domain of unknown function (DUF4395)
MPFRRECAFIDVGILIALASDKAVNNSRKEDDMNTNIAQRVKRNFILQQGLTEPEEPTLEMQYSALQFQPRSVGLVVLLGIIVQSPAIFLALAVILWWGGLAPRWNPFDIFYNFTFGKLPGAYQLNPAPAPRRFAGKMSGTFALVIGIFLLKDWNLAAYVVETIFVFGVISSVFRKFCLPAFMYHAIHGNIDFAMETLPWSQQRDSRTAKTSMKPETGK